MKKLLFSYDDEIRLLLNIIEYSFHRMKMYVYECIVNRNHKFWLKVREQFGSMCVCMFGSRLRYYYCWLLAVHNNKII